MGFLNDQLLKNGNKKETEHYLTVDNDCCRKCGSDDLDYIKLIGYSGKIGMVYHYKAICQKCNSRYLVKRTKRVFDIVKNKEWIKTKGFKNKMANLL